MKVCYVDDSGNLEQDPCLVMAGILVDANRLSRTRQEFAEIFEVVQGLFEDNLRELKGSKMIFGRDRWRKIDPDIRKRIADFLCNWIVERKHRIVFSAIDRTKHAHALGEGIPVACKDAWLACGLHIALQLQKINQDQDHNKGHTFLMVDENKVKGDALAELLWSPPDWTDDYYSRGRKQDALDQIIDSAFGVKSHHAGLVQVADLYAFIFRRYAELNEYGRAPEWKGEAKLISQYIEVLRPRLCASSTRYPKRSVSECAKWFVAVAPESLKGL